MRDFFRHGPVRASATAGLALHTVAVAWAWWRWGLAIRSVLLLWMDFPLSLLYAGVTGRAVLLSSLVLGGALWAGVGALLAALVGRAARER